MQEYFTNLGIHPQITNTWIEALVKTGLILNYDPTILTLTNDSLIEISPSGTIHLGWATLDTDYIQVMKDVTPLRDKDVYDQLISDYGDYKNKWKNSIKRFIEYLISEDAIYCKVPIHSSFTGQEKVIKRLEWITEKRLNKTPITGVS